MYSPSTGRFSRLDPFSGNVREPQSLHKYTYAHDDPVNGIDPSGEVLIALGIGAMTSKYLRSSHAKGVLGAWVGVASKVNLIGTILAAIPDLSFEVSFGNTLYEEQVRSSVSGMGGADITAKLTGAIDSMATWWRTDLMDSQSDELTSFMLSKMMTQDTIYSFSGWDMRPLNSDQQHQRAAFATDLDNWAPRSVTVQGDVYYAHEVNYFLWGAALALASEKQTSHGQSITKDDVSSMVWRYRTFAFADATYLLTEYDGSKLGRAAWADAGWDYIKTGVLSPPHDYQLPKATPNQTRVYSDNFQIQIGSYGSPF